MFPTRALEPMSRGIVEDSDDSFRKTDKLVPRST